MTVARTFFCANKLKSLQEIKPVIFMHQSVPSVHHLPLSSVAKNTKCSVFYYQKKSTLSTTASVVKEIH